MICTAPKGMLNKIAWKLEKPKLRTIKGPKVVIPPLGIETAVSRAVQIQVLGSRRHSQTWSQRHVPEAIPCWFMRRRSIAMSFSEGVRKRACMGESGSQM